ncbi:hypothetical protein BURMUCF2_1162 [Burkholderia multivorans CF2]|nr:hypothetical protein BURMUCF2_1162 [Burkholderia multivorans CF2]
MRRPQRPAGRTATRPASCAAPLGPGRPIVDRAETGARKAAMPVRAHPVCFPSSMALIHLSKWRGDSLAAGSSCGARLFVTISQK